MSASSEQGMFGVTGSGDTSGFGGLVRRSAGLPSSQRPYGGYLDEVADSLEQAYPGFNDKVLRVVVEHGELTLHVKPEAFAEVAQVLRDDPTLRFEFCSNVSGVDYLAHRTQPDTDRRLHVTADLLSMTFARRIRIETAVSVEEPHVPSLTAVYPTADWQEREVYDFFGVIFDGHPALTRIEMPDDWAGHPQRKDYPLGGIDVEYKGASVPPPDTRRSYA